MTNYNSQAYKWLWFTVNIEYLLEIKEMESLGLDTQEILGALDIMLDNNPEYLEATGKS